MAVDRAIQLERAAGSVPPTLRLYGWERPTVTLGRFQGADGVDRAACLRHEVDVVRRATGGRGVLHDDEVTYSVIASLEDGIPRGVAASYRHLGDGLVEAYRRLGVEAELTSRPRERTGSSACYLHATGADLSVGVAKLSGSAQVWLEDTVLQHGSFVRTRVVLREAEVFGLDADEAARLGGTTATLADLTASVPTPEQIIEAAVAGFESALGVRIEHGVLTEEERARAFEIEEATDSA
jgi:lipoate-protein ligase A